MKNFPMETFQVLRHSRFRRKNEMNKQSVTRFHSRKKGKAIKKNFKSSREGIKIKMFGSVAKQRKEKAQNTNHNRNGNPGKYSSQWKIHKILKKYLSLWRNKRWNWDFFSLPAEEWSKRRWCNLNLFKLFGKENLSRKDISDIELRRIKWNICHWSAGIVPKKNLVSFSTD